MRKLLKVSLAGAFALGLTGLHAANAADMSYPQGQYEGQYEGPPQAYGPPPVAENYPPPPVAPPPVVYALPSAAPYYAPPPYVVVPGPYYAWRPYWRGYPVHYAFGYGRWGHGYHHW